MDKRRLAGAALATGAAAVTLGLTAGGATLAKPAVPFGCPAAPLHAGSSWAAARHQLAPRGAVAIRLCRYSGVNAKPPLKLVGSGVVTQRQKVAELVKQFNSLKALPGAVACPADDGSRIVALLGYTRHEVTISVGLAGCSTVTNGRVRRTAANFAGRNPTGPRLVAELKRLAR